MAKKIELQTNSAGGIDLLTERDAGNEILILTGKPKYSKEFWQNLRYACDLAIEQLEEKDNG